MVTIRPSATAYRRAIVANLSGGGLAFVVLAVTRGDNPIRMAVLMGLTAGLCASFAFLYFRNTRVTFDGRQLARRNMWGRTRRLALDQITEVIHVVELENVEGPNGPAMYVLGLRGRRFLKLSSVSWSAAEMRRLRHALDLRATMFQGVTRPSEVRRRFVTAMGWREAHPILFACVVLAVAAALTALLFVFAP